MNYDDRLNAVIPGGAHTYSRGKDQFPSNAPQILTSGKGAYVFDPEGKKYLDYGMGLRAVNIGYANPDIDAAAIKQINFGNNLTRPSIVELEAAEAMVSLIDSYDMVKFAKNGSTAASSAVKLARAFTGRDLIVRCKQHPFFSYDDWFVGSTEIKKGIPNSTSDLTITFNYNDINGLSKLIDEHGDQIAGVILEPSTDICPKNQVSGASAKGCCEQIVCSRKFMGEGSNFLQQVQKLCNKNGIVFVLDEMITGFRWSLRGAQHIFGVTPDLTTFGKAMANGYSVACVGGRRDIMELGSIDIPGQERTFLMSSTHGAEMSSLGAFVKTTEFIKEHNVIEHCWDYGDKLRTGVAGIADDLGISSYFNLVGPACSPIFVTKNKNNVPDLGFRTLFNQEMISNGVMMPWIALSYSHRKTELEITLDAIKKSLTVYGKALDDGLNCFLRGHEIKPVFRKYN